MSMPSINLHCSHCDFRSCTTLLWGRFKYVYEEGECNLDRQVAWCYQCEKLVPCESFDDSQEILEKINKAVDCIQKSVLRPVSLTLTKSSKKYKRYDLEIIRSL
ncbi:hypothetical protein V5J35_004483 [Endozoicomonas sp. NE40]|uniref:Uncharacterized protein n=1 Tax=Endozoicomonas lisbonensis TaxID=3120522 RepID=A0ABV2SNH4_9GAMM